VRAPPGPVRLLGGGGSYRGTKAGPTQEAAAARSLFALLVAEEERVGASLRRELT
jgi:hypothetical protein